MKKSTYKREMLFLPLLLLPLLLAGQEVSKDFHQEYNAGANTTLEISNRYGDVVIDSWDQNKVVIDVKVTVEMQDKEKARKLLDYINIEFSENDNTISAKTVIDDKFNFSNWGGSRRFSINYNVRMPAEAALALSNKYGNSSIDELHGLVKLDIKYGNINAGKLTRGDQKPINRISLSYGKGSVDETGWLDLYMRYVGNMDVLKSKAILVDSKYSRLALGETSSVVGECRYDNLKIDLINNLVLENGYTEVNIGTLNKKLEYNGSYGSFTVERVPAGFESLKVDTRYTGVRLGIDESASYQLDARVSYGELRYNEDNFRNQHRVIGNTSKEVQGIVGKGDSPSARVNVTSSYGPVRLE